MNLLFLSIFVATVFFWLFWWGSSWNLCWVLFHPPAITFSMALVKSVVSPYSVQGWPKDMRAWFADLVFLDETRLSLFWVWLLQFPASLEAQCVGYKTSFLHSFMPLSFLASALRMRISPIVIPSSGAWMLFYFQSDLIAIHCLTDLKKNILSGVYNCYLWSG